MLADAGSDGVADRLKAAAQAAPDGPVVCVS